MRKYLLLYIPETDYHNHPEDLEVLISWSEVVQAEFRTKILYHGE